MKSLATYVGRVRHFSRQDWLIYVAWVGTMFGLVITTGTFLLVGETSGVELPDVAWLVPVGALVFALSIAIDTIGHRTVYRAAIVEAEGLVHGITILCGVSSCILLCAAYSFGAPAWIPALVLTVLSFVYSMVDEVFHWRRYLANKSDPVEMWSHLGILTGHGVMMLAWWKWYFDGYAGVAETLRALGAS